MEAALKLAAKHGYQHITREQVAAEADVGAGTVNLHYSSMAKLKKEIVRHAVRTENLKIIAQAIVAKDPYARRKLTEEQRQAALMSAV